MHKLFQNHGGQGAVFHYELEHWGHGKFFVILNDTWPPADDEIVYAYMTSQVGGFEEAKIPESTIVRLEPGDYPFCKLPTVIDVTGIDAKKSSEISNGTNFKFVCELTPEHMNKVLAAVKCSTVVRRKHKKAILAAKYG